MILSILSLIGYIFCFVCMVVNGLRGDTNMIFISGVDALMCFMVFLWNDFNNNNNSPKRP